MKRAGLSCRSLTLGCILVFSFLCRAQRARAHLINGNGDTIGVADFSQTDSGIHIRISAQGLSPGVKGLHIHETGVCDPPDFQSAGGHFNPGKKQHGFLNPRGPHAGDLPNILAGEDGRVQEEITTALVTLRKDTATSLLRKGGTSLVIHEGADDYLSDPTGMSGGRIACGVVREVR